MHFADESKQNARRFPMTRRLVSCFLLAVFVVHLQNSVAADVVIEKPVLFNTNDADRILARLQIFPADNPWNQDISARPLLANSKAIIATIGPAKHLAYNLDMAFVL